MPNAKEVDPVKINAYFLTELANMIFISFFNKLKGRLLSSLLKIHYF